MHPNNLISAGVRSAASLAQSTSQVRSRIRDNELVFSKCQESHLVELAEIDVGASQDLINTSFKSLSQLSIHLESTLARPVTSRSRMEIYFLHQRDTWSPLSASWEMVALLADHYDLSAGFFQMLGCFRDRLISTEEGFSGISRSHFATQRSEFGWVYKYSEKKKSRTVLFVISPSPTAHFTTYLKKTLLVPEDRSTLVESPILVHSMLISMHLPSWQEYLEYHETLLLKLDMKSACSVLEQPLVTYDTLKSVREVEKNILPVSPLLTTFEELVDCLQEATRIFTQVNGRNEDILAIMETAFTTMRRESSSYKLQAMYMQTRAQMTAQSVLDSLNLGFQKLAQDQSRNTFIMARFAREDSVAIRAITLVTSFYLPFSFVATMFGMNLVDFDLDTRNLLVSNQFWLYFLVSIPLTAVTLACWRCRMQTYRKSYTMDETVLKEDARSGKSGENIETV
ncbi:hypothetical protein FB567DRAFT_554807 [Paraphoma chrysanthemicola]|uniref:CorA-like transporter domain-containing protein n=1 Tax=Paraphoma chrysanthemicola TaxID=798071 RepID=A0A8K0QVC2_9PLEO|nr:hypothetical protein FB567DRAFT_554807 [Paraphoma chrysanthemicola]